MKRGRVRQAGRTAWALVGILVLLALTGLLLRELFLAVVPLVLALFPASLLIPVRNLLERWKVPRTVAAFLTLFGGIVVLGGVAAGSITLVVSGAPEIAESAGERIQQIEELVGRVVPGFQLPGMDELLAMLGVATSDQGDEEGDGDGDPEGDGGGSEAPLAEGGAAGNLASMALTFTAGAVEVVAGLLLILVILFFFLRNGRSLAEGAAGFFFPDQSKRILTIADEAWDTLGSYFRGQLLVALVDAVFIGVALLLLGIPLAVPLAVLVFFGGLFPIVGAVVTGGVAVLVAFAHAGPAMALAVAGIVLLVQQLESNVLEPLILSRVLDLQPLTIILSITLGATVWGYWVTFWPFPPQPWPSR